MSQDELIKLILGILVIVAVGIGLFLFFKDQVIAFFKGLSFGNQAGVFIAISK